MRVSGLAVLLASIVSEQARAGGGEVLVVVGLKDEAVVAAGPDVKVVTSAANARLLQPRCAQRASFSRSRISSSPAFNSLRIADATSSRLMMP